MKRCGMPGSGVDQGQSRSARMAKLAKEQRRAMRRRVRDWRRAVIDWSPAWLRRRMAPLVNYADLLLVDHGIFRLVYVNRHRLGSRAWRAAQPGPGHIRAWARQGVRTIVNLRGERFSGSYWLERDACAANGITLVDFQVRSRAAPDKSEVLAARRMFDEVTYPMVMHCKSGADRAGLMSTLYMHLKEGLPIEEARRQLSLRFGHIRLADTGILDHFFDSYLAYSALHPIGFMDWVEHHSDPEELKRTFRSRRWARFLTDRILRRE